MARKQLDELLSTVRAMPTIMSASQELAILRELEAVALPVSSTEIWPEIREIIDRIDESHAGGGIFEVGPSNRHEFDAAASWLRAWAARHRAGSMRSTILGLAETLSAHFPP